MDKKFLFLLSQGAGRGNSIHYIRTIQKIFAEQGMKDRVELRLTEHAMHVTELAHDFSRRYGEKGVVYSCGGDGSLGEATSAVIGTGCALGVVPMGTGNDFAKTVYTTLNISKILPQTPHPQIRLIDVIELEFENGEGKEAHCINVMSFGFDTLVLSKTYDIQKKIPSLGGVSYFVAVGASIFSNKSFLTRMHLQREDGTTVDYEEDNILAALCNGRYYGNGFNPAPMAEVDDGVLHLVLAQSMSTAQLLPLIYKYKRGDFVDDPRVQFEAVVAGTFEGIDKPILGNHDGTIFESQKVHFRVLPRALPFAFLHV